MLAITDRAAAVIGQLVEQSPLPEDGGLRVDAQEQGDGTVGLDLSLVEGPAPGDAQVDHDPAHVFLEPQAAAILSDRILDAEPAAEGQVLFTFRPAEPD
jgi:Fe-S cluster assembly iron-binding protein IscA